MFFLDIPARFFLHLSTPTGAYIAVIVLTQIISSSKYFSGQKPYVCDVCNAKFSDPSSKRRHEREHMGNKPYLCQLCGESFKRAGQLKAHLGRKHTDENGQEIAIIHRNDKGSLEFSLRDGSRFEEIRDELPIDNQANIIKLLEDPLIQHVQITLPPGSDPAQLSIPQIIEMEAASVNMDGGEKEHVTLEDEGGTPIPLHIGSGIAIQGEELNEETVIAITEVAGTDQMVGPGSDSVEYTYQIIANMDEHTDGGTDMVEVQYQDEREQMTGDQEMDTNTEPAERINEPIEIPEETTPPDFVANPDFNSQAYYNWLTNFTELCKVLPMPLEVSLFQKISQVHKTLSDLMANPSGVVADKENFRVLMQISKELNTIINEHLTYILENLGEERMEDVTEKT